MATYRVTATRDGDWWSLVAADVGGREVASQSRRLDQADSAIRDAIALVWSCERRRAKPPCLAPGAPSEEGCAKRDSRYSRDIRDGGCCEA
jgi:hypothetical protein